MRIVSREELAVFTPTNNTVLIRNILQTQEIQIAGKKLFIDNRFSPEYHQSVVNEVVSTPKFLTYGKKKVFKEMELFWDEKVMHHRTEQVACHNSIGMPWRTPMELMRGDVVWVSSQAMRNLDEHGDFLLCEGERYYIFPYYNIYLKRKGQDIHMLNGWILVEPVIEDSDIKQRVEKAGMIYADKSHEHYESRPDRRGIVRFMGLPITEYEDEEAAGGDVEVSIGDTIVFKWGVNRRIEHEYHSIFSQPYIVSRRRNIAAIIRDSLFN